MNAMELGDIARAMGGRLTPISASDILINKVAIDSRDVVGGEIFFALMGERDGHDFIEDAVAKGVAAAVVSRNVASEIPQILVDDTLAALGRLAATYRKALGIPIVAVTGSLGKTTARELIARVLAARYTVARSEKNFNNLIGLPLSILEIEKRHDVAVLELGISVLGEMAILGEIASPEYAVILNVAPVHLEGLGSLESVAREKIELLKHLRPNGRAFLCADDERLMAQDIIPMERVTTFGYAESADYRIEDETFAGGVRRFTVDGRRYETRVFGKGVILAAACAVAVAAEFGISEDDIAERIAGFEGVSGRLQLHEIEGATILEDFYNSSPKAVEDALSVLSRIGARRRLAVLGDMLELGRDEAEYHIEMGRSVARFGLDRAFFFGRLSKSAADAAVDAGMPQQHVFWTDDFGKLRDEVMRYVEEGDVVLIKGSRAMRLERLLDAMEAKCAR